MCILNIEPRALHRLEHCLDLPALLVCVEAFFRPVVRDENLQLQPAVAPFDPAGGQVAGRRHKGAYCQYADTRKHKLISLLTNDMDSAPEDIIAIYRQRWEIELLFKQIKQNFPLKYFYGESANAIKIQIWVTLIANLILMVMQRRLERKWSFSGLATMVRIALMYYVDFYNLFNNPEKDWENMAVFDEISPHQLTLF